MPPAAALWWLTGLGLYPTLAAAFLEFVLSDFAVTVHIDHLEVDDEGGGLAFGQSVHGESLLGPGGVPGESRCRRCRTRDEVQVC